MSPEKRSETPETKTSQNPIQRRRWILPLVVTLAAAGLFWGSGAEPSPLRGQTNEPQSSGEPSSVFTPEHSSLGEAVRHFLGIRPDPEQPIPFQHWVHIDVAFLTCEYCHDGVSQGPIARIPSIRTCIGCHSENATGSEAIQLLTSYWDRGQEPPWQRVYGWTEEAHVRFHHAPHIRAEVDCSTCHGDVALMEAAERVVDHTMSFCVDCHTQNQASNECLTCHY